MYYVHTNILYSYTVIGYIALLDSNTFPSFFLTPFLYSSFFILF